MTPSLAQIREQIANPRQQEQTDLFVYEDSNGSTSSFDPTGRRKFQQIMTVVGYVELPEYKNTDPSTCYMCGSCQYFTNKSDSPTGYLCDKFKFPDRPFGCCNSYDRKD